MTVRLQIGKLNVYRNASPEELSELHLSDRLMVQLIKIDRLGPRIEGMAYRAKFDEACGILESVRVYALCTVVQLMIPGSLRRN